MGILVYSFFVRGNAGFRSSAVGRAWGLGERPWSKIGFLKQKGFNLNSLCCI